MSLYLVFEAGEYTLHAEDGQQINSTSWTEWPTQMELVEALAEEHQGASILGNPDARWQYTQIVTGDIAFRNLRIDDETLPWE